MFRALFSRSSLPSAPASVPAALARSLATRPPQEVAHRDWPSRLGDWLGGSGWRIGAGDATPAVGQSARAAAIAAARLDFAESLWDVRTAGAAAALDRIAVTRSLHELWYLRGEVFAHVALRHDQAEAGRRVAELDRHFDKRARRIRRRARTAAPDSAASG